ncbi:MAG: class I SAM-dependent methyltransferase [Clostridiales bacterium]|nr:class I SAM-dependent methyltransferase [Clostridiales bacterium]
MLDSYGFDLWADSYDDSVRQAEEDNEYPFAGYSALMNAVYGTVMNCAPAKVLDVGFGTAVLSKKLYDAGCKVTGIDFSAEMLQAARRKMPRARLLRWDFTQGIPPEFAAETFDFIISTYALHHLAYDAQASFILALLKLLKAGGRMLIGDVCFETEEALLECREQNGELWDDEEYYIVFSRLQKELPGYSVSFHPFSFCCGVIAIGRGNDG